MVYSKLLNFWVWRCSWYCILIRSMAVGSIATSPFIPGYCWFGCFLFLSWSILIEVYQLNFFFKKRTSFLFDFFSTVFLLKISLFSALIFIISSSFSCFVFTLLFLFCFLEVGTLMTHLRLFFFSNICSAINCSLSTVLAAYHTFWYVIFLSSFIQSCVF